MSKVAEILNSTSYLSEVRKVFATAQLPTDMPNYWEVIAQFASSSRLQCSKGDVQLLMQNLRFLNEAAFVSDKSQSSTTLLLQRRSPWALFSSSNCAYVTCGASLCIRKDRPSHNTLYRLRWHTTGHILQKILFKIQIWLWFCPIL